MVPKPLRPSGEGVLEESIRVRLLRPDTSLLLSFGFGFSGVASVGCLFACQPPVLLLVLSALLERVGKFLDARQGLGGAHRFRPQRDRGERNQGYGRGLSQDEGNGDDGFGRGRCL